MYIYIEIITNRSLSTIRNVCHHTNYMLASYTIHKKL